MAPNSTELAPPMPFGEDLGEKTGSGKTSPDGLPGSTYPGIWKYPTGRDDPMRIAEDWFAAKQIDDDVGSLWRIYDKLYDLQPFIKSHPGGSQWLEMSRGTDITEAFEASHVVNTTNIRLILKKYYVRDATSTRIAPFTFKTDGFYMTLKRKCEPIFKRVGTGPTRIMLAMEDSLVLAVLLFGVLGAMWNSVGMALLSGLFLAFSTIGAHNFMHLKENWRRYYFDLSLNSSYEWRITHAFSHPMYPNTLMDIELSLYPTFQFLPNRPKHWIQKKFALYYSNVTYAAAFWIDLGKRVCHVAGGKKGVRPENFLVLGELALYAWAGGDLMTGLKTWAVMHTMCSWAMLTIGATASHHHTTCFVDGDEPLSDPDFGIGQLDATKDRAEDFFNNLFVTLITFGHHPLHHLFPTVCHSKLHHAKKAFEETVREFKIHFPGVPQKELYFTCYEELGREHCNKREKKIDYCSSPEKSFYFVQL